MSSFPGIRHGSHTRRTYLSFWFIQPNSAGLITSNIIRLSVLGWFSIPGFG